MTGRRGRALLRAKAGYTATLQGAGRALDRAGLLPAAPPDRAHRTRHWVYSLTRVHDSTALADLDVPWWTYRATDAVEAWLAARPRPVRVFEYGSGASTVWLGRRANEVHSVEHDRAFAALFAPRLAGYAHIELRVVEPVAADRPVVASAKEGYAGFDFADYVAAIDDVSGEFDVVVVDGRARAECLHRAVPRLRPGGIVVFDNSRRARYRPAIAASGLIEERLRGLTPTLPYPEQTSLLLTSRP